MEKTKVFRIQFLKFVKNQDHVDYHIRLISPEDNSINVEFFERYSALYDFNEVFKKQANSINFPKFPSKKWIGNTDEKFLNKRLIDLQYYFNAIFGSKEFSQLPSLKKWVDELIKKYNKNPTQGKEKIVEIEKEANITNKVSRENSNHKTSVLKLTRK